MFILFARNETSTSSNSAVGTNLSDSFAFGFPCGEWVLLVARRRAGKEAVPNANYLWINLFATSLKPKGRAALVMANSASDARHSEAEIRRQLIEKNLIYAMLTLPSNMFYTVTLPATLWFFDRAKSDNRILFIDARNTFMQIDRAHREFSDAQIENIGIISHLRKGRREKFVQLVDRYFAAGMERLVANKARVEPVSSQLLDVLENSAGKQAVAEMVSQWAGLDKLQMRYQQYRAKHAGEKQVDQKNKAQRQLRETFDPFFAELHQGLKDLDRTVRQHEKQQAEEAQVDGRRATTDRKTKALKTVLEELHKEVKNAELFYQHIRWLQERFPKAAYEDVTGLCKLASQAVLSCWKRWLRRFTPSGLFASVFRDMEMRGLSKEFLKDGV